MKLHKLVEGEIYKITDPSEGENFWMIGKVLIPNNGDNDKFNQRGNATFISSERIFYHNRSWCYASKDRRFEIASWEEKQWLLECIELGRFIPFSRIKNLSYEIY